MFGELKFKSIVKIKINSFWPAIAALIVTTFLFCLPGGEFPKATWLDKIHLDKFVHVGLFSVLVFLWILPPRSRTNDKPKVNRIYFWIIVVFVAYGVAIEFIQVNFIPHRSFDFFDIVADAVGCAFGGVAAKKTS